MVRAGSHRALPKQALHPESEERLSNAVLTSRWYDAGGGGDGLGTSSESLEAAHETSRCVFAIDTRVRWVRRQRPVFAGSTSAAGRTTMGACGSCPLRERGV